MQELMFRNAQTDDLQILRRFEQGVVEAERPFNERLKISIVAVYNYNFMEVIL